MEQTMLSYINEQPHILTAIMENIQANTQSFVQAWLAQKPDRFYLIASGTSHNAAGFVAPFFEEILQVETTVCAPSALPKIRGERPFLLFISQGGNSNNTLAAIAACHPHPKFVLVGSRESRMASLYPHALIACGEETSGPKTKGYTSTVLTLQLMALEAAQATGALSPTVLASYRAVLASAVSHFSENLQRCQAWLQENTRDLAGIQKIFLTARAEGLPVAAEGALKLLETMLIPSAAFEFEEYLHGPICALDAQMAGLYLLPPQGDELLQRMLTLAQFHRSLCPFVYTVGSGADGNDLRNCCVLTTGQWYTSVYEWVPIFQLMGAVLPDFMGTMGRGHKVYVALNKALNVKFEGGA